MEIAETVKTIEINQACSAIWMIGWIFSIGYLHLPFWKGVLALFIWPYYVGKHFHKPN
ncbi:MAG: hypothetical protein AAB719_00985 [Patescibacteria group bacterium]